MAPAPAQSTLTHLLSSLRNLTLHPSKRITTNTTLPSPSLLPRSSSISSPVRQFSTSSPQNAPGTNKGGKSRKGGPAKDPRISLIRYHMQHPKTPRPLKLSRMRALRHWTIHRAWMLSRRIRGEREEGELQRMYQSMHHACEQLRLLDPPTAKDSGRLYRIAMEKKGIFGQGGVPIEYARAQTDTPGREAWNHGWTR